MNAAVSDGDVPVTVETEYTRKGKNPRPGSKAYNHYSLQVHNPLNAVLCPKHSALVFIVISLISFNFLFQYYVFLCIAHFLQHNPESRQKIISLHGITVYDCVCDK